MLGSLRSTLENKPQLGLLIAGVVFVAAISLAIWTLWSWFDEPGNSSPTNAWYFDQATQKLFVAEAGRIAPFTNEAGNESVHAQVYSCDDCSDTATHFIGYLKKYSPQARQLLEEADKNGSLRAYEQAESGLLVSNDNGATWHYASSEQGALIQESYLERCKQQGKNAQPCEPE